MAAFAPVLRLPDAAAGAPVLLAVGAVVDEDEVREEVGVEEEIDEDEELEADPP
jgi:hypothetical protein